MKHRDRNQTAPPDDATHRHGPDVPYWLPADSRWDRLPQEIRHAVERILSPASRRRKDSPVERMDRFLSVRDGTPY